MTKPKIPSPSPSSAEKNSSAMIRRARHNQRVTFIDKSHEAVAGIWWTGNLLKKYGNAFFSDRLSSEAQFNIMMLLKNAEKPLTQNDLSERLLVDKSNITGLIDRMEKAGLVKRIAVKEDRRCYHLKLTPTGEDVYQCVERPYYDKIHKLMSIFSETEVNHIIDFMDRLQEAIFADDVLK